MKPHEQRVVIELTQLSNLREKLESFNKTVMFSGLPADEQARLQKQLGIMVQYEEVLQDRINHFPK